MKRPFLHQHYPGWLFNMLMLILILGGPCIVKGQTDQGKVGDVILNGKSYEVLWDLNGLSGKRQALRADQETRFQFRVNFEPFVDGNALQTIFRSSASIQISSDKKIGSGQYVNVIIPAQPNLTEKTTLFLPFTVVNTLDNDKVVKTFKVSFTLIPPAPTVSLSQCEGKPNAEEKLTCLREIREKLRGAEQTQADQQIRSLEEAKNAVDAALSAFSHPQSAANNRFVRTLKGAKDFMLSPTGGKFSTSLAGDRLTLKLKKGQRYTNYEFTLKHKDWPSLEQSFTVNFIQPQATGTNTASTEDEITSDQESATEGTTTASQDEGQASQDESSSGTPTMTDENNGKKAEEDDLMKLLKENWAYAAAAFIALFFLIAISRRGKKDKQSAPVTAPKSEEETSIPSTPTPAEVPDTTPVAPPEKKEEAIETTATDDLELDIDIIEQAPVPEEAIDKLSLVELTEHRDYLPLDLEMFWSDTAVRHIYMHYKSINGVFRMVRDQNAFIPTEKMVEDIPEIGGFLLGHIYPTEGNQFDISIEKFVPITAESQNRYTVKFGGTAWSELDDSLKAHPGIKLVGWFHTHPGHGLFLSEADLREHRQLFRERYQVAMEIDPLTAGFDTAFFSWTKQADLNNLEDRRLNHWWQFTEIETNMRQRALKR
ncbi:MAG: hypothetical protein AAFQ83_10000 [Bacteroidota bacterium]